MFHPSASTTGCRPWTCSVLYFAASCRVSPGSIPQHEVEEESRRRPFQLGDKKDPRAAVRKHVQADFPGKFHRHVESVYRGRQTELMERLALFVDENYRPIVVGVLNVQGLTSFLGAEIAASWHEKVVVNMPDQGGPSIVQHPLDDSRRDVFVPGIRLKHCPVALVRHRLRFEGIVLNPRSHSVARVQGGCEHVEGFKVSPAGVEVPVFVDWPQAVLWQDLP